MLEDGTVDVPMRPQWGAGGRGKGDISGYGHLPHTLFQLSLTRRHMPLAYETAWLKRHYPAEFMAALMTSVKGDPRQVAKYIRNCKEMGIQVLLRMLQSEKKFSVHDGAVRFGMMGIKNVGDAVIDEIIRARKEYNPSGISKILSISDISKINKKPSKV